MNSSIINLSEILNRAKSLVSAGYCAGYNFDEINAAEFFDELVENSTLATPIFSGILIMQKLEDDYTIIDGLQRLTTLSLLLCALCEIYKGTSKNNEDARNKVFNRFLAFGHEPKLQLKSEEQEIYKKILFSYELSEHELKNNLVITYKSFLAKIKEHKISGTDLFKMISKIQFMQVITEQSEISIRELYQALNNNKDDSQISLITDFIKEKGETSQDIWQKILYSYKSFESHDLIEDFISNFLTIQNDGKIPAKNALYNNFKSYFSRISKYQDAQTVIENMSKYSGYYLKIVNSQFDDEEIKAQILTLNEDKGKDAYPYLMEVLDDLANGHISREVFLDILTMVNSFVKNRDENQDSNAIINFANLSKELNKMLVSRDYEANETNEADENKITINEMNNLSTFEV